ncbi:RNA polymerase sigma factor [Bowmanella sp. JS7-9]|uniref:RNA polymerase sigma factor n=1 Tax=Pseudobowmanella zhangzhouensis TaxID=1537679 RepID=A0ABW1XLL0_9ALTE|nr:sigma-70 family RNA polymerase sigma factor [Bowmanella sp. JS7-9]TBX20446.1 RNA polymerase sigma70 [Bowmanella sp. JS7-9]
MFEQTDEKLISKALAGHAGAWTKLVRRYDKAIYHYALRMCSRHDDAQDLMQDIFMAVCRNLATYRGDGEFKAWLFRIAHFRVVEYYRRKKPLQSIDDEPEVAQESQHDPDIVLFSQRQGEHLAGAMQQLPLAQKAVVELKFYGQFTCDEIASQLGVSANTVKSRLYAALDKLKLILEAQDAA